MTLRRTATALAIPVLLLAGLVAVILVADPAERLQNGAPPAEEIAFERVELAPERITLHLRNAGPAEVTVAQVLVDDAYWQFTMSPSATLGRYGSGVITLDYPWVEGEAHAVALITSAGTVIGHEIPVAVESPRPDAKSLWDYALIGILVGVLPVAVGMLFHPALRSIGREHYAAVLALTLGVLAFLAVDTVLEGIELAEEVPGAFQGTGVFFAAALVAILAVMGVERMVRGGPVAIAVMIAIAIGLHNLGEGLLIGSSFALGSLTLGSALIAGFALHNVTEGPAIVGPLERLPVARFLILLALAGLPTVLGAWLGAFAATGLLAVLFFGLGAGAILVVIVQVARLLGKSGPLVTPLHAGAFTLGFVLMLATALLIG